MFVLILFFLVFLLGSANFVVGLAWGEFCHRGGAW